MNIINSCYLVLLVFMAILVKNRDKNILNPLILFYSVWALVMGLHSMNLYGLYKASHEIYSYIFLGLIFFGLGYYCTCAFKKKYKIVIINKNKNIYNYILRYSLVYILAIICILFFLKNFLLALQTLVNGNTIDSLRVMAQDENSILNSSSNISNFIYNFIVLPSATVIEVVAVVDFWFGKRDKHLFIMNIIIIIMRVISDAGRTPLFNFALYMIFCYLLSKVINGKGINNIKLKQKMNKKIIRRYGILGVISLGMLTFLRSGALFLRHLYFYFAMAPYMFNHWASVVDKSEITSYGTASMNGYVFSFFYFIKNLINTSYPEFIQKVYDLIAQTDSLWINIAPGSTAANAYVSAFWFFYLDGRLIGIVVGMFLYGSIATTIYLSVKKTESIKMISLYIIIIQGIVFSFIRFPFAKIYYALAILMLLLLVYKPVRVKEKIK